MLEFDIQALSGQGGRSYQEDCQGHRVAGGILCLAVSDGAGGHGGGHIASELAVRAVLDQHAHEPTFLPETVARLIELAHRVVHSGQQKFPQYPDMRATLVIALCELASGRILLGNVGDSRAYVLGAGGILLRTRDHSIAQQMIDAGMLAADRRERPRGGNVLFASLGMEEPPEPYVYELAAPIAGGESLLLCTDGFWEALDEQVVCEGVQTGNTVASTLAVLESQLLGSIQPGHDNYTALLARSRQAATSFVDADSTVILRAPPGTDEDRQRTVILPRSRA
jgi:PPM family protein phosphatase